MSKTRPISNNCYTPATCSPLKAINTDPSAVFNSGGTTNRMIFAIIVDLTGRTFERKFDTVVLTEQQRSCGVTAVRCFFAANSYIRTANSSLWRILKTRGNEKARKLDSLYDHPSDAQYGIRCHHAFVDASPISRRHYGLLCC